MKYDIKPTHKFQKDLKRIAKRGLDVSLLTDIIKLLANGQSLPESNRDHALRGGFSGCRECHIAPDWLLIYEIDEVNLYLYLTRTGTHSDFFSLIDEGEINYSEAEARRLMRSVTSMLGLCSAQSV